jgi:hypothetical protein
MITGGHEMEVIDYKVAVYFGSIYGDRNLYCSCGWLTSLGRGDTNACAGCGNTNVASGGSYSATRRIYDGIYTCIEKTDKSFHVRKQEVIVNVSGNVVRPKMSHVWEMKYNIIDRTASITKNGEDAYCGHNSYGNVCQFFKAIKSDSELMDIISTERSRPLYKYARSEYGAVHYERTVMLGRALMRLLHSSNLPRLELFTFAGFGSSLKKISGVRSWMQSTETTPQAIMGVPKYILPYLRELDSFSSMETNSLSNLDKKIGGNNVKLLLQLFKEESTIESFINVGDMFTELYDDHGYRDINRLGMYLAREVKLEQGISSPTSAATLLRDYVRMCKAMDVEPKEKLPKSLKKLHDIAQMNNTVAADPKKNADMKTVVESPDYKGLEYKKKPYIVVTPIDANELIKEGSSLSHCVASYVNDVIKGTCKILFLRAIEDIGKSLVTIEVRDNNIRQVRGAYNRRPDVVEMAFVREWAEKKLLNVATH